MSITILIIFRTNWLLFKNHTHLLKMIFYVNIYIYIFSLQTAKRTPAICYEIPKMVFSDFTFHSHTSLRCLSQFTASLDFICLCMKMETLTFDSSFISLLIFNGKQKMENYFSSKAWSEDGNSLSFSACEENLPVSAFCRILSGCMDIK